MLLDRLLQLYLHDFSELAPIGSAHGEVDDDGLFAYPSGLDAYWRDDGHVPLLIRVDERVAGFALVNRWSALDRSTDRAVAEFFVLRKYRRRHVATRAAHMIFDHYPGQWEVAVADYNPNALLFWRETIRSMPVACTQHEADGRRWRGTVFRFRTAPAPP